MDEGARRLTMLTTSRPTGEAWAEIASPSTAFLAGHINCITFGFLMPFLAGWEGTTERETDRKERRERETGRSEESSEISESLKS
jgi:hypothetical protein